MNEVLKDEGLDSYNTWEASYSTLMVEAGKTEVEQKPKESTVSFFVAENLEYPVMGEYHETDTLAEAVELFRDNPEGRLKGIGIALTEGNIPIVQREEGMTKMTDLSETQSKNPLVQKAFEEVKQYFPEGSVTEHQPREAQDTAQVLEQRAVETAPTTPTNETAPADRTVGKKESILKALRKRQTQIKEREKQKPEQKTHERKKGEQTL